jgi:hypothetical protein
MQKHPDMQTTLPAHLWPHDRLPSVARMSRTYRRFVKDVSAFELSRGSGGATIVTEDDLASLPRAAQRYLHFMRVVGTPRDRSFHAGFRGQFRLGPREEWLPCEAWQFDDALDVARVFHMELKLAHVLPTVVRDTYVNGRGRMLAKVLDLFRVADASGDELDIGELVTYLNDAILYAPTMILRPHTQWIAVGEECFDVKLTDRGRTVTARVLVDPRGAPYEFSTRDRFVNDPYKKGHPLVRALWTTPVSDWISHAGRVVPTRGSAIWHLAGSTFEYARFELIRDALAYNVDPTP